MIHTRKGCIPRGISLFRFYLLLTNPDNGRLTRSVTTREETAIPKMITKCAIVGGRNSKKVAVAGIIGNPMASAMEITERITIDGAGQPALVIGAKERIDNINNISVNTLAMNQLVCSTAGEIR